MNLLKNLSLSVFALSLMTVSPVKADDISFTQLTGGAATTEHGAMGGGEIRHFSICAPEVPCKVQKLDFRLMGNGTALKLDGAAELFPINLKKGLGFHASGLVGAARGFQIIPVSIEGQSTAGDTVNNSGHIMVTPELAGRIATLGLGGDGAFAGEARLKAGFSLGKIREGEETGTIMGPRVGGDVKIVYLGAFNSLRTIDAGVNYGHTFAIGDNAGGKSYGAYLGTSGLLFGWQGRIKAKVYDYDMKDYTDPSNKTEKAYYIGADLGITTNAF